MKVLLDTDICIYLLKNDPPSVYARFRKYLPDEIGVSSISVSELYYGVAKSIVMEKSRAATETLLLTLTIVPFDLPAAMIYGQIRADLEKRGTPIGPLDMLIAAQALAEDVLLVTNNLREYRRVPGLRCESWV